MTPVESAARLAELLAVVGLVGHVRLGAHRAGRRPKGRVGRSSADIVAAGVAMGWDHQELSRRMRQAFVEAKPLSDFTLPLVAVLRGKKVTKLLQDHFGERSIEDLDRTYFCVSSNLTLGREFVHRDGPLWRALERWSDLSPSSPAAAR